MAATLKKPTLRVSQGSTKRFLFVFKNKDGTAFNLAGFTIRFGVKGNIEDEDFWIEKSSAISTEILVVGPTSDGKARLFIIPDDTVEMQMGGKYIWDAWLDDGTGDEFPASDVAEFQVGKRVVQIS